MALAKASAAKRTGVSALPISVVLHVLGVGILVLAGLHLAGRPAGLAEVEVVFASGVPGEAGSPPSAPASPDAPAPEQPAASPPDRAAPLPIPVPPPAERRLPEAAVPVPAKSASSIEKVRVAPVATKVPIGPAHARELGGEGASAAQPGTAGLAQASPAGAGASGQVVSGWDGLISAWIAAHKVYPGAARERDEEGDVTVRFSVTADGTVSSVTVLAGSGSQALDSAARELLNGAHVPAPEAPVARTVRLRYRLVR